MKATARTLTGLIALAWSLAAAGSQAGTLPGVTLVLPGGLAVGQMGPGGQNPGDPRAEVADLLARARQAMQEGNLTAADLLIRKAEGYRLQYGMFHNGDTPEQARRDLEAQRSRASRDSGGDGLLGRLGGSSAPNRDPFVEQASHSAPSRELTGEDRKSIAKSFIAKAREELAQNNFRAAAAWYRKAVQQGATFGPQEDSPERLAADIRRREAQVGGSAPGYSDAGSAGITPLPSVNQVSYIPPAPTHARRVIDDPETAYQTSSMPRGLETASPGQSYPSTAADPDRVSSDELLREARLALAYHDVDRTNQLLQQAGQLRVAYGPHDDSPQKVGATMRRLQNLSARRPGTETYQREYAEFLLEESKALMAWGEYDEADRLARKAAEQRVAFRPGEVRPEDLIEQIRLARRSQRPASERRRPVDVTVPGPAPSMAAKQQAEELVSRARAMLDAGDLRGAEHYAREAERMRIPDSQWGPREDRPAFVLFDLENARRAAGVMPAAAESIGTLDGGSRAAPAVYDPSHDRTRNEWAGASEPIGAGYGPIRPVQHTPSPAPPGEYAPPEDGAPPLSPGMELYERGMQALEAQDVKAALDYFRQANQYRDQLDPTTAHLLQEKLQLLSATHYPRGTGSPPERIPSTGQSMSAQQVYAEIISEQNDAMRYLETDPKRCQATLEDSRRRIESLEIDPTTKGQLVRAVDRRLDRVRRYIQDNLVRIEQVESNRRVRDDVERDQRVKLEIQQKLALMVDEYNRLIDEERFEQAELLARKAAELDPNNPVVQQLLIQSKILRRYNINLALADEKERGVWEALRSVDDASIPFDDMMPYQFGDPEQWADISRRRMRWLKETGRQRSDRELEIEQKLQTPVLLQFTDAPLSHVMTQLAKLAQVNLYLDPHGLAEEGVMTDTPVSINLPQEVSLKSALNIVLEPLNLSYVIKDEVLKVTSVHLRDNETFTQTYPVADLVIPIPNFVPNPHMGMAGALRNALGDLGYAGMGVGGVSPMAVAMATKDGATGSGMVNPSLMAQMTAGGPAMGGGGMVPIGFGGPGGLGGAAAADFESLEALITGTVQPDTWQEVGGPGTIDHLETNLSLVIRQTQEVHEEITELLEQLRRLQDLQVTIEVRFITLNDNFFERIGVDFDFDIDDNIDRPFQVFGRTIDDGDPTDGTEPTRNTLDTDYDNGSITVGLSAPNIFSADLDIPFTQNSFGLAIPQFGGYDPAASASIGFAILSDIEAFFFIEAAQGDRRSNILQAPKVTLFNGQQAFVSDTSQSPFVISVIPVVGDFAAAQQPVIVVLSEGTFLTVQAVVSNDRRFVRLTVVPFFSEIGEVETFQFTGSETTSEDTSREGVQDEPNNLTRASDSRTVTRSGTTVQLPTFSFITVTTTVSVPDGGTVLLGGIKRLSEGRNEFGVPMLNKIPYVNRLFKNVGIGRETQSLMMMVTPRIIIQEEEEENLGILTP